MQNFEKTRTQLFLPLCSFVSFVVGLCLLVAGCAGEPKHPTWKNATGGEQHERLIWQAIQQKDWDNVERHLSPTFVGVSSDGQMFDRAGWLEHWKNVPVGEFALGELQVQPEGPDMKVAYVVQLQGAATGGVPAAGVRVVSVWQQVKKGWMLSATTLTPIQSK